MNRGSQLLVAGSFVLVLPLVPRVPPVLVLVVMVMVVLMVLVVLVEKRLCCHRCCWRVSGGRLQRQAALAFRAAQRHDAGGVLVKDDVLKRYLLVWQ